jgi:hypothetical protein
MSSCFYYRHCRHRCILYVNNNLLPQTIPFARDTSYNYNFHLYLLCVNVFLAKPIFQMYIYGSIFGKSWDHM